VGRTWGLQGKKYPSCISGGGRGAVGVTRQLVDRHGSKCTHIGKSGTSPTQIPLHMRVFPCV
jgi:hypothetical protein